MSFSTCYPRHPARAFSVLLISITLPLAGAGCTSIDQSFALDETDLALAAATVPKVDVVADEPPARETSAPVLVAGSLDQMDAAVAVATDGQVTADAEELKAVKTVAAAALPIPAAPVAVAPPKSTDATPVLALREPTKRSSPFGFLSRERKADPTPRTTRRRTTLKAKMNDLAKADVGVQTRTAPRRSVTVIKPKAKESGILPGVRSKATIFGIAKGKMEDGAFRVASAAGLARGGGGGSFVKQTPSVSTECFKPGLVAALGQVERKFGQKVVVTSGYRSPKRNRRAGGAKKSKHMTCEAADIQVPGVSKAKLAAFLRSMPDRGGVGTYCHTKSVHYDIGSKRDWSWGCRRR